jgi:PucR C-terminal helix-turn-helix domain
VLGRLPELTDRTVALIVAEQETGDLPPEPLADLRAICEANLESVLRDLAGRQEATVDVPRETARHRAEQGVSLASVLHGYRLGMRVVWEAMNEESTGRRPDNLEVLLDLVPAMWALFDTYQSAVATAYDETLVDLARRSERERTLLLDDLLAGRDPGAELRASMAAALDLPERGPFLAVSAEGPASGGEGLPKVDQVLRLHGIRSAWRLRVDEQVGIVALSRDHPPDRVRALLAPLALTRTGISPSYDRLGGTAVAVALAGVAARTLAPGTAGVASVDDHPLGALVAGAPDIAALVVRSVLGGVFDLDPDERSLLLETVEVWADSAGSATEAGKRLFCHRNTVRNRLARLEELTGRSLADPRSLAEVCTAVEAVRLLPADLLFP